MGNHQSLAQQGISINLNLTQSRDVLGQPEQVNLGCHKKILLFRFLITKNFLISFILKRP